MKNYPFKHSILALAVGLLAVPALAADLPVFEEPAAAVAAAPYDWSGPYVGLFAGYGSSDVDWTYLAGGTADHSGDGFFGGVQAGFNHQIGIWVLGIEGDIAWANIDGATPCPNPAYSCESEIDWLGSLRLRAGFAANQFLFYATGGLGVGDVTIQTVNFPAPGINGTSNTMIGWTAGGGVAGAFGNWIVGAEYLYYDLGDDSFTVDAGLLVNADVTAHTGKVFVKRKF